MNDAAVLDAFRRIVREELAAALLPRRALTPCDRAVAEVLLPAIVAAVGDSVWLAADLAAFALRPEHEVLALHVAAGLRRLGKLFARLVGHDVDGLTLRRIGESGAGVVWQVSTAGESLDDDSPRAQARR